MAINDILAQVGDGQDLVIEIPAGNTGFIPSDVLMQSGNVSLYVDVPAVVGGGGGNNIFIMSE